MKRSWVRFVAAEGAKLWVLVFLFGSAGAVGAGGAGAREKIVYLPPFVVTGIREGLPWKYARVGEFEVLSLSPDYLTRDFVAALYRGRLMLPGFIQAGWSRPVQVILFDEKEADVKPIASIPAGERWSPGSRGLAGISGVSDDDSYVIYANLHGLSFWPTMTIGYARACVNELAPAVPAWLETGLVGERGVYSELSIKLDGSASELPLLAWRAEAETERLRRDRRYTPPLVPLGELFGWRPDPQAADGGARDRRCEDESGLFVRWALYGRDDPVRDAEAFWRFAREACQAPVTEATFERHFHVNYAAALKRMGAYLHEAVQNRVHLTNSLDRALPEYAHMALRPATEAEVARIKGNWERLEARELREQFPELARRYRESAARTLHRGYKLGGQDDPALLAVLGLDAYERGQAAEARPHLERAFAARTAGARELLALTRLRLAEERKGLAPGQKLSAGQVGRLLDPLFAARSCSPAVAEVYDTMAEVWELSAVVPSRENLAVLAEGVRLFPGDAGLRKRVGELEGKK